MRAVIQRVSQAKVVVDDNTVGQIGKGFMILLGVHEQDTQTDVDYLVGKISKLRVFEDEQQKMNRSIIDVGGEILSISQFTLFADTKKGNRPSFVQAAKPDVAIPLYESFNEGLRQVGIPVETGIFGADMKCHLVNDGPVTIIIDSQNK
ncbi:D-aminoacyl-tRNA deacylase [Enterococcus cecorum]|uniref:D-aminoacyl-tRNA deacylase n=1 Tax=Enterococcus cecorum TaxID=44008 RepID=UPI002ACA1633|nr:D-aminoacyl-tRNA deacylase [Enterococcus cecorum]MDZ5547977.1 D-aminoacyl-tRNA deacylase [Enterococcus cecorum]MDZ5582283.1 D-aminoacyl-tRNA deacylase [Enterococcus cecorum]MDZ5593946.1 D-aminoacyl-tRNA deacylase [Enterococcus cecorum]